MTDISLIDIDSVDNIKHDIHCLSNEIKFLLPNLVTRIEFNKAKTMSYRKENKDNLNRIKQESSIFLKELQLFAGVQ